jgi:hypothetical protein
MDYKKYIFRGEDKNLIIEEDKIGWYLIVYHKDDFEKSEEDYLIDSLEDAYKEAEERFGVLKNQWEEFQ